MKYAIISDLHANESALRHVLADASAEGADQVICLGDVVGYGPLPAKTVALVRRTACMTLAGNHDDAVSGRLGTDGFNDLAGEAVKRHREELNAEDLAWLKALPHTCKLEGAIASHGDFTAPSNFGYVDDEESAARNFEATDAQLMFVGHTHVPGFFLTGQSGRVYRMEPEDFVLEDGKRYLVNPGSVGYPRENDGTCCSSYVLYDSSARTISFRFLPFAVSSMIQRGTPPRRRTALVAGLAAIAVAALAATAYFVVRSPAKAVPATVPASAASPDLTIDQKSITLRPGARQVRANLKVDARGDPVDLRVEFKSATGELLSTVNVTVIESSARRFKVPADAISAHFTVMRQKETSHSVIQCFAPDAL